MMNFLASPSFTHFWTLKRKFIFVLFYYSILLSLYFLEGGGGAIHTFAKLDRNFTHSTFFLWTWEEFLHSYLYDQLFFWVGVLAIPIILWWIWPNFWLFLCVLATGYLVASQSVYTAKYMPGVGYAYTPREYIAQIPFWLRLIFYR